jgi:hypothetical protein
MTTESKKLKSDTLELLELDEPKNDLYIWVVDVSQSVEIMGKPFHFELGVSQEIEPKYLKDDWFVSSISKGYLKLTK